MIVVENVPSAQGNVANLCRIQKRLNLFFLSGLCDYGLAPILFCEQNVIRRHFRHSTISVDALMQYMRFLTNIVPEKVKAILPGRFAIVFDGWTGGDSHYVSAFSHFLSNHLRALTV